MGCVHSVATCMIHTCICTPPHTLTYTSLCPHTSILSLPPGHTCFCASSHTQLHMFSRSHWLKLTLNTRFHSHLYTQSCTLTHSHACSEFTCSLQHTCFHTLTPRITDYQAREVRILPKIGKSFLPNTSYL